MAQEFKEKTITVNLRKVFQKPATKRAISGKNMLKVAVFKETRFKEVSISNKVNEEFWKRGKYNCPRKITVKVVAEKGRAVVLMPDEKYAPKQDKKGKEKEAKKEEKADEKSVSNSEAKTEAKKEGKVKEEKKVTAAKPAGTEEKK